MLLARSTGETEGGRERERGGGGGGFFSLLYRVLIHLDSIKQSYRTVRMIRLTPKHILLPNVYNYILQTKPHTTTHSTPHSLFLLASNVHDLDSIHPSASYPAVHPKLRDSPSFKSVTRTLRLVRLESLSLTSHDAKLDEDMHLNFLRFTEASISVSGVVYSLRVSRSALVSRASPEHLTSSTCGMLWKPRTLSPDRTRGERESSSVQNTLLSVAIVTIKRIFFSRSHQLCHINNLVKLS